MRREANAPDLMFRTVLQATLMAVLAERHPFAPRRTASNGGVEDNLSSPCPIPRRRVRAGDADYVGKAELRSRPTHEAGQLAMAISLVAAGADCVLRDTRRNFLDLSVVSRPIKGRRRT